MKVPLCNRFITVSFLYISAMALLIGFTLSSFFVQTTSEWAWTNMAWSIALASGLALCLVLFLLFRAHAQSLAKVAQRSRELAAEITEHKRVEEALAERTTRLEAVRDVAVEITRELDLTTCWASLRGALSSLSVRNQACSTSGTRLRRSLFPRPGMALRRGYARCALVLATVSRGPLPNAEKV